MLLSVLADLFWLVLDEVISVFLVGSNWKERVAIGFVFVVVMGAMGSFLFFIFRFVQGWAFGLVALLVVAAGFAVLLYVLDWVVKLKLGE